MERDVQSQSIENLPLRKELVRKSLHVLIAFLPLIVRYSSDLAVMLLGFGAAVYCLSEYVRLTKDYEKHPVLRFFSPVMRVTEFVARGNEGNGFVKAPLTLALGAILSIYLFPFEAMMIGVFALAFGDTAAALIGSTFPIRQIPFLGKKSLGGTLGCFIASTLAAYAVLGNMKHALLLGFIAALVESIPLRDFDNICIPVVVGWVAAVLL